MKDLSLASLCSKNGVGVGVYEVELLENGQLKFTVIEDECAFRVSCYEGGIVEVEWEPVP